MQAEAADVFRIAEYLCGPAGVHVSKCTAGVPPARGRLAERRDEGGRDARGTLWATHLLTCTRPAAWRETRLDSFAAVG
ncbi:MAG: hypothetical protein ABSE73_00585 [Planctomycetota bacterium]